MSKLRFPRWRDVLYSDLGMLFVSLWMSFPPNYGIARRTNLATLAVILTFIQRKRRKI